MRLKGRTDANQEALVKLWRKMGVSVWITSNVGGGGPDCVLGLLNGSGHKVNVMIEIKDGQKIPSKKKLTVAEEEFHANWRGDIRIIKSVDEAVSLVNSIRQICF